MNTVIPINERPATFEELAFNAFFANPEIGICILGPKGNFLKLNRRFCEMAGYSEDELLRMTLDELTCSVDDFEQGYFSFEKKILKKDRSVAWLSFNVSLIPDNHTNIYLYMAIVQDISCRKNIEKEMNHVEEMLDRIFDTTSISIAYMDADLNFIRVNKKYADAGNHPAEFYIGKNHFELYPYGENEIIFRQVVKTGQAVSYKAKPFTYKEYPELGTTYWDWDLIPVKDDKGTVTGLVFFLVDVTERKKAEFESNAKSEYIANMSHELRTPLNVILSGIQLFDLYLRHDPSSKMDKIPQHLKSMRLNCYRLLRLVNNLIDTTKIDADFYDLNLGNYDIVNVVETLTHSVTDYVKSKRIKLSFSSNVDKKIIAFDIDIVERIMLNLLSNSIKFTESEGTIQVNLTDKGESLAISVKDDGAGIPADKQKAIFERYKQADQLLTRRHEGSGIGLSLTKSFIEMLGGSIHLISEYGQGSEFIIELPCRLITKGDTSQDKKHMSSENKLIEKIIVELSDIYSI